jgi:FixJ family two-component response regulator
MIRLDHSTPVSLSAETLNRQTTTPVVHVGGDIPGLEVAIQNAGWHVNKLESLDTLLEHADFATANCLIIDLCWSELQNRSLQERISSCCAEIPFICVVEATNLATAVALMKLGALDVLGRSIVQEPLIDAIRLGLQKNEAARQKAQELRQLKNRYDLLSLRERQILTRVSSGLMNKQIAGDLGISEITVKAHRGTLMRKMEARSFASLVKMAMVLAL